VKGFADFLFLKQGDAGFYGVMGGGSSEIRMAAAALHANLFHEEQRVARRSHALWATWLRAVRPRAGAGLSAEREPAALNAWRERVT